MAALYHPVHIGALTISGNLFLAPVAGYSDRSFRAVCRKRGADFAYTEMVSAEALVRGSAKTETLMRRGVGETLYGVQLFGASAKVMAEAAALAAEKTGAVVIDVNAGCPVPKIVKTGAGAALTRDPKHLFSVIAAMCATVAVPVTVKIRSGWSESELNWREAAEVVVSAGAAALTVHPRTRSQGYEGKADWGILKEVVKAVARRVPVFGSGDVWTPEDARRMLEETGVDGVFFARGALGNPFVFAETRSLLTGGQPSPPSPVDRIQAAFEELSLLIEDEGEQRACVNMRKRFAFYLRGLPGAASLRALAVKAETLADYQNLFPPSNFS